VGVEDGTNVRPGEVLTDEHLIEVRIPSRNVGNLKDVAYLWAAVDSVRGFRASRPVVGGSLVLRQDLRTPPEELKLGENEGIIWIPVDTRSTVPSLIVPGDKVSFLISKSRIGMPTRADEIELGGPEPFPEPPAPSGPIETVGPFTVLSLGNRLGSPGVLRAARRSAVQENVFGIRVELDNNGELMPDAQHLISLLNATNNYPVGIMLHGRGERSG